MKKSNRAEYEPPNKRSKSESRQRTVYEDFLKKLNPADMLITSYDCDACERDITKSIKILCSECESYDLCLDCFVCGTAKKKNHELDHAYYVMDRLSFPLFTLDWSALEELNLIHGIEKYGMDNWPDISDMVGNKNIKECEEHYYTFYYKTRHDYLPEKADCIFKLDTRSYERVEIPDAVDNNKKRLDVFREKKKKEEEDLKKTAADSQALEEAQNKSSAPGTAEAMQRVLEYMPKRGDFFTEYDNDAESVLADMEFFDDDKPAEKELKLKVIELYNRRLDERIRRKKFVIDWGLLNVKKQQALERKRTKEEKDIYNHLKIFSRFSTPTAHQEFVENVIRERRMRELIQELNKFREMGLTSFNEVEAYIQNNKRKDKESDSRRYPECENFLGDSSNYLSIKNRLLTPITQAERIRGTQSTNSTRQGATDISNAPKFELLGEEEKKLCVETKIQPEKYLKIKEEILRYRAQEKIIVKSEFVKKYKDEDKSSVGTIVDFVVKDKIKSTHII